MFWFGLACVLLFLASKIWESYFTPEKAAREIVADTKAIYTARHKFAEVSASAPCFRDLDHGFYARAQAEFDAEGFRYLGDIEDRTVSRQFPKMRTFVRLFLGDGGSISGNAYHGKVRGFWMRLLKLVGLLPAKPFYIDLETEFSDRSFVATSNTLGADLSAEVPGILRQTFAQSTPLAEMVQAHRLVIDRRSAEGIMPLRIYSVGEAWEMQHRLQEVKNAAKAELGYVDHQQIGRVMAQTPGDDSFAQAAKDEAFAAELVRLRQQNFSARSSDAA